MEDGRYPGDISGAAVPGVVTQLVMDITIDEDTGGETGCEAEDIGGGEAFLMGEVAEGCRRPGRLEGSASATAL